MDKDGPSSVCVHVCVCVCVCGVCVWCVCGDYVWMDRKDGPSRHSSPQSFYTSSDCPLKARFM